MQIKFKAKQQPITYQIDGEIINGIDLQGLQYGGRFVPTEETQEAGVHHAYRDKDGELWVTLHQAPPITRMSYKVQGRKAPLTYPIEQIGTTVQIEDNFVFVDQDSNDDTDNTNKVIHGPIEKVIEHRGGDWTESEWIDARHYDPQQRYIQEI